MNVIEDLKDVSGGYQDIYNGLTCIVGEEIVRLLQCEVTRGELPWLRGMLCLEIKGAL